MTDQGSPPPQADKPVSCCVEGRGGRHAALPSLTFFFVVFFFLPPCDGWLLLLAALLLATLLGPRCDTVTLVTPPGSSTVLVLAEGGGGGGRRDGWGAEGRGCGWWVGLESAMCSMARILHSS